MKNIMVLPCSDCGASMRLTLCRRKYISWKRYEIVCLICGHSGRRAFTKTGAVEKWNNDKGRA